MLPVLAGSAQYRPEQVREAAIVSRLGLIGIALSKREVKVMNPGESSPIFNPSQHRQNRTLESPQKFIDNQKGENHAGNRANEM